jgi:hypothetical protein
MAAPKDAGDARPAPDSEVDFAGYDPYIVALTGGAPPVAGSALASAPDETTESRKVKLMTWLRERRA